MGCVWKGEGITIVNTVARKPIYSETGRRAPRRRERTKQRSKGTAFLMETAGAKALGQESVCMKNQELANNDELSQKEWASQPNLCEGVNIQYQGFSEVVAVMVGATRVENE